jgi:hypothetical protein
VVRVASIEVCCAAFEPKWTLGSKWVDSPFRYGLNSVAVQIPNS